MSQDPQPLWVCFFYIAFSFFIYKQTNQPRKRKQESTKTNRKEIFPISCLANRILKIHTSEKSFSLILKTKQRTFCIVHKQQRALLIDSLPDTKLSRGSKGPQNF